MDFKLEVTEVGCKSIRLEWSKPEDFSVEHCLFELSMDEYARTWVVIYRGFHTYFHVKNLSGGHFYNFRILMESIDKNKKDSILATATTSCTTKNDYPSITAFHHSAYQNLPLLFREFLDTRARDVDVYNELGECGLFKACAAGHYDMVLTLLQHGADVNSSNIFTKITPLMMAAYHGHCDVIRILAHNDADADKTDINWKTALHYAVDGSQNDAVKMLLERNWSNVNSVDSKGWTPLMRAVLLFTNLDVIKTLVNYGSDLSIKDKNGQNIWQLAHLSNNWKALKILPD